MDTSSTDQSPLETKYDPGKIIRYKITTLRNRMFGLWLADQLGKHGQSASEYAESIIQADYEEAGDGDILRKAQDDLRSIGHIPDEWDLRALLGQFKDQAEAEIQRTAETTPPAS